MAAPGSNKRILTEIQKLQGSGTTNDSSSVKFILDKSPVDSPDTPNVILGRILPNVGVYSQAAFQIEIKLPTDYPFKAPEVRFITPIYHPNVDDKGKICVDILNSTDVYKPTTPLMEIVKAVANLIDNPNIDHALTPELAAEYTTNKKEFERKATAMVKQHGLPRQ